MTLLKIDKLNVHLGGLRILQDVDMEVNNNEMVVVVGANGAGKTTLARAITGTEKSSGGKVIFNDEDITNKAIDVIAGKGISMVPQGRQLFPDLTAAENLRMGAYLYRKDMPRVLRNLERMYDMFPVLRENKDRRANTFSGGEQQMLSIGRGLMSEPKLLIIDELSLGLAPRILSQLLDVVKSLKENTDMSILLVEQNVRQVLKIADRGYVLENGVIEKEGTGEELLNDEYVRQAYLGL